MKTSKKCSTIRLTFNLLVIFAIALIFASCTGKASKNLRIEYSENGIRLSSKIVSVYKQLDSIMGVQVYQKELIEILNDASPETYILKIGQVKNENDMEHLYKLNTFLSLEKVFTAYNLEIDPNVSTQSSNLLEKVRAACIALDSANISEELKLKNDRIKFSLKNKFVVDEAIFQLTDLYAEFWHEESLKWIVFLQSNHEDVKKGIESIPVASFNMELVKEFVHEPYTNSSVLANLYKLNLIKENQQFTKEIQNKILLVSDAFNLIIQVQGEMLKRNKNEMRIQELNSSIELLVND